MEPRAGIITQEKKLIKRNKSISGTDKHKPSKNIAAEKTRAYNGLFYGHKVRSKTIVTDIDQEIMMGSDHINVSSMIRQ